MVDGNRKGAEIHAVLALEYSRKPISSLILVLPIISAGILWCT